MKTVFNTIKGGLVAALVITSGAVQAQTFGAETRISNQAGPSLAPSLAASGTNLHIVWSENIAKGGGGFDGEIYIRTSNNNGSSWNTAINISNNTSRDDKEPIIAVSGNNVVVFWTNDQTAGEVFYAYSTNGGSSFSTPTQLTSSSGYSRPTGALIDSAGRVHLAYYDNSTTNYGVVFHMCSPTVGGSFGSAVGILNNDGIVDNEAPRLAQAANGTVFMLYRSSRNGTPQGGWPPFDQYMLRSSGAPSSCNVPWVYPPQKVSRGLPDELVNTYGSNLITGNSGKLHAAWWDDRAGTNLYYRPGSPESSGWGVPVNISRLGSNHLQWDGTAVELTGFGFGEDTSSNVHFAFADRTATNDGYLTGNLYYTCINSSGTLQPKISAKDTGAANAMMPRAIMNNGVFHIVWSDFRDAAGAQTTGAEIYYRPVTVGACSISATAQAGVSVTAVAFGGQSTGTTSPAQQVTVSNIGSSTLTISGVSVSDTQFAQTNNCTSSSLAAGASCTINITFSPNPIAGAVNATSTVTGTLSITSNGTGSPNTVSLGGTAEKSLVTHYYRSILRRAPDSGGKAYWESEAVRLSGKGVNINEVWYAMAMYYYFSPEYQGFNRDSTGFVTDLYNTFFNRSPDSGGLNYWVGQIGQGMPREVVLAGFMFSYEFVTFTQGIFGNTAARPEVDTVMDFYRGLLARLPESTGLDAFVANFRAAQCNANPGTAVYSEVDGISKFFLSTSEYLNKNRTNGQYVGDLYNAFLRRGGDLGGVLYWIDQLATSQRTREKVREAFFTSSEFASRVQSVIGAGCLN